MKKFPILFLLMVVLLLSSCGTPAEGSSQECIVGTWQLTGMEAYARALLPPGAFDPKALNFNGAAGLLGYTFNEDGSSEIQALDWMGQFSVAVEVTLYQLDMQISGIASGSYSVDGNTIKIEGVKKSDLTYMAFLDGETMVETFQADEFAPLYVPPFTTGQFTCTETTLSLQILNQPGIDEPITFQRVVNEKK